MIDTSFAAVQSRVDEIHNRIAVLAGTSYSSTSSTSGTAFSSVLSAQNQALAGAAGQEPATNAVTGSNVVQAAKKYLGVPYVFGGTDPAKGLDCSSLVQQTYKDLGIELPRLVRHQRFEGTAVSSLKNAQPGDLLVFDGYQHIGIYVGDGKMIHAPEPGDHVRIAKVYEKPTSIRRIVPTESTSVASSQTTSSTPYQKLFTQAAARYGVPASLLSAVAKVESNFDPTAVSRVGAQGMMQLMPSTASGMNVNAFDPSQAVDAAARILRRNLDDFGSVSLALAAYNAGAGAVRKYGGIPPYTETQNYVKSVLTAQSRYNG